MYVQSQSDFLAIVQLVQLLNKTHSLQPVPLNAVGCYNIITLTVTLRSRFGYAERLIRLSLP